MAIIKEDCFAWNENEEICMALNTADCANCHFYKHSNNPAATRRKIAAETSMYYSRKSSDPTIKD